MGNTTLGKSCHGCFFPATLEKTIPSGRRERRREKERRRRERQRGERERPPKRTIVESFA